MQLSIKSDFQAVDRKLQRLRSHIRSKVTSAALNKVGQKARTQMTREITGVYRLKAKDVRDRLNLRRASRRADQWLTELDPFRGSRRRSLNVIRFLKSTKRQRARARQVNKQLKFLIKRAGGAVEIPGAFVGNNGRTVFERAGRARLPIRPVSTVGVPSMFNARRVNAAVMARIRRDLPVEFERAMARFTK